MRHFYHCFPRRRGNDEIDRGLSVLSSILDRGLLLTPERIPLQESLADGSTGPEAFILQKRICFTELSRQELAAHCSQFGSFAIEWDVSTLIQMGAVPVFYVPMRSTPGTNDGAATAMLLRLGEIQELLSRLERLQMAIRQAQHPLEALNITINGQVAAPTACTVAGGSDLLAYLQTGIQPISTLTSAIRYAFGYFYPTENLTYNGPLDYYRQREWRILANLLNHGVPVTSEASTSDIAELNALDGEFFGREFDFPSGRKQRAAECALYRTFQGRHILTFATRLVVPHKILDETESRIRRSGLETEVVPLETYAA